jgi:flagellin
VVEAGSPTAARLVVFGLASTPAGRAAKKFARGGSSSGSLLPMCEGIWPTRSRPGPENQRHQGDERVSLSINTNVAALNAQRNLQSTENRLATSMEQLSSGLRINQAANDVAGYAISARLEGQINGLNQAYQNSQDAVSLTQTAQGSLNEVGQIMQRVRTLAVQYANGTNSTEDKKAIEEEVGQLNKEIERVGETTKFGEIKLLSTKEEIKFQVGANDKETIGVNTFELAKNASVEGVLKIKLGEEKTISEIDAGINAVSKAAGEFGSVQDRLQYTQSNQEVYSQNLAAANSAIKDVNMAQAMTNFTQEQVLQQAGTAMLSQANSLPQAVLKLVG